jgi:DNA-binding response OmpR family regulator
MEPSQAAPRALVVSLDAPGAPAQILREAGCDVTAIGYDLSGSYPRADVVIVVAGDHLEIGKDVIKRLRQRSELVESRFLVCVDVSGASGLDPEVGADDFILMPIAPLELWVRVKHLLWRDNQRGEALQIRYGTITLDCEMRQAYRGTQSLGLTPLEFQLMRFLVERVGRVYTRRDLLLRVWGYQHGGRDRTVDTHVLGLRTKLGETGSQIVSIRGLGYKLERAEAVTAVASVRR